MTLKGREVILGVGGGISAYKSAELLRRLQDIGLVITVVPTAASLNFVGKATWEALSGRDVPVELWENVKEVPHIALAKRNSAIIIAPTTADLLAKVVQGVCDDLLTNIVISSDAPQILVPAMHPEMWSNPATIENVKKLRQRCFLVVEPDEGRMTGNDLGIGRYPEIPRLVVEISKFLELNSDMSGKRVLVTAGGTRENIAPVRYIGTRSSGKQGLAIAKIAQARGADVTLISSNISDEKLQQLHGVKVIPAVNTNELQNVLKAEFSKCDALIMAAAVSDAKPTVHGGKLKKANLQELKLEPTPDLLAEIAKVRKHQLVVGFAAEAQENLLSEGKRKLTQKALDLIYANDISEGAIFGSDQTSGLLIDKNSVTEITPTSKEQLANILLDSVAKRLNSANV